MSTPACEHADFKARVGVHRIEDRGAFVAEVQVQCAHCGLEFSFLGLPSAISIERPCVNIDGTVASIPMEPGPQPLARRMTINVPSAIRES
jgi:hypothetical protein